MRVLLILAFLGLSITSMAIAPVISDTIPQKSAARYEQRGRKLVTIGAITGGIGLATGVAGVVVAVNAVDHDNYYGDEYHNQPEYTIGIIMGVVGYLMILGSIPMLIIGSHFKKKARRMSMAFKAEDYNKVSMKGMANTKYPAFTIRFRL